MSDSKPITCLGIMVADLIGGPLFRLPDRSELVLVKEMGLYPGGCAVNTATALARLGLPVDLVGKIGRDALGDFLLAALTSSGVDTSGVRRDAAVGTSATMVMIDPDGERRFVHYIGANATLSLADIDLASLEAGSILHVGGCFIMPAMDGQPTAQLMQEARAAGVVTCLDSAWDASGRWMDLVGPCLPYLDYFVPNLAEARAITGQEAPDDVARVLLDHGVQVVALKMGADGCLVMAQDGQIIRAPAYDVSAVDTTGAGDAFAAGFIAGVYLEWPLQKTARLANAVGAMCVTGSGAAGGVTTLDETLKFMEIERKNRQDLQD